METTRYKIAILSFFSCSAICCPTLFQDLASLGVPFLSIDEDGRSVLNKPLLTETKEDDKPAGVDQPPKPNEDFPDCTTYFYHRWMWIQVYLGAMVGRD